MLEKIKRKVFFLYQVARDERAPWRLKLLLILIVAYVLSPIDLIPDFIPILGLLDELVLLPWALALAYRMVPDELKKYYEDNQQQQVINKTGIKITGIVLVVMTWIVLLLLLYWAYRLFAQ